LQRYVVDASALIEMRRNGQLRYLTRMVHHRQILVPVHVLKRLEKARSWREWLKRNRALVTTSLVGREHEMYAELIVKHGSWSSNPRLQGDDIMGITMACCRSFPLVMRDRNAERVARSLDVDVLGIDEFLREIGGQPREKLI
jgi:predicted nucleic acid-binding protein